MIGQVGIPYDDDSGVWTDDLYQSTDVRTKVDSTLLCRPLIV